MTTNDIDALDEALIRPGRADRQFHIDYLTTEQLNRLVKALTGTLVGPLPEIKQLDLTPADIVEILKHHIGDPEAGVAAVRSTLEGLLAQERVA